MDALRELLQELRKKGVDYADLRRVETTHEGLTVKNGRPERCIFSEDRGVGIRVLFRGAWGFAATSQPAAGALGKAAARALKIARASALVRREPVRLAPLEPQRGHYRTPIVTDPITVPLDAKIDLLLRATEALRRDARVRAAEGSMDFLRTRKLFLSTEGAEIEQEIFETGAGMSVTAVSDGEAQTRSYPNSHGGDYATAGYEFVEAMDLPGNADRIREEALALLDAPECPAGEMTVILEGSQLALQIHESCGHPIELDRVLGHEWSYAGGSFLSLDKRGTFRYGSPAATIVADATAPGGLGTFGFDDEGVPAQRTVIVDRGIFVNYLTSRETAPLLGQASNGTMRADGWNRIPLIRMVNINLEPSAAGGLDDLLADTRSGLLLATNKSWSIDQLRLNFQFGCEIAWEIRDGRRGQLYKNPVYTGITPQFWGGCDAVCGREAWRIWGVPNCGKGEPPQTARVGHGTAPARFRNVQVGVQR